MRKRRPARSPPACCRPPGFEPPAPVARGVAAEPPAAAQRARARTLPKNPSVTTPHIAAGALTRASGCRTQIAHNAAPHRHAGALADAPAEPLARATCGLKVLARRATLRSGARARSAAGVALWTPVRRTAPLARKTKACTATARATVAQEYGPQGESPIVIDLVDAPHTAGDAVAAGGRTSGRR